MARFPTIVWLVFLVVMLTSPRLAGAAEPTAATPDSLNGIRRIAIVSAVGEVVRIDHFAFGRLGAKSTRFDAVEWGLDQQAEAVARDAIGARFDVVAVTIDRTMFETAMPDPFGPDSGKKVVRAARALSGDNADAYLLITKRWDWDHPRGFWKYGLGTLEQGLLRAYYAAYDITLIRARDGAVIAQRRASLLPKSPFGGYFPVVVDGSARVDIPDTAAEVTAQDAAALRDKVTPMLLDSLRLSLGQMGLGGAPAAAQP